jgi:hypothetical protein
MSIQTYDVKINDSNITYYTYYTIGKLRSMLSYSIGGSFEANNILDNIYLGGIGSANDYDTLKTLGITHIVSVIAGFSPPYPDKFHYFILNALDTTNTDLSEYFDITNNFIEDALDNNGKVLIHCMAGKSRSVTILAAYLIKNFGMSVKNALAAIKNKRDIIEPNLFFINQLYEYYNKLYK